MTTREAIITRCIRNGVYDLTAKRKTLIKKLAPATRYEDALARQEGCFVRGQKDGNSGDVIRLAESAKRGHSYYLLLGVTAKNSQPLKSLRRNPPRAMPLTRIFRGPNSRE